MLFFWELRNAGLLENHSGVCEAPINLYISLLSSF